MKKPLFLKLILGIPILVLTACMPLLQQQTPDQIYLLNPPTWNEPSSSTIPVNLIIAKPEVSPGLDTERIASIKGSHDFIYFTKSRWPSISSDMLRSLLIESFQNYGSIQSVTSELIYANTNYRVRVVLQDLQAEYEQNSEKDSPPFAHITIAVELMDAKARILITSFRESVKIKAEQNTMTKIVFAFDQAFQKTSRLIVQRITEEIRLRETEKNT